MIITDDFIMLNFPKTGSSFAREVLKKLYTRQDSKGRKFLKILGLSQPANFKEIMLQNIDEKKGSKAKAQHGTLKQIPHQYKNKPILSITRNPLLRLESTYFYRWWEKYPPANINTILEDYPHFPNLSFSEYNEMLHTHGRRNRLNNITPKIELGFQTIQFIQFYFKDPELILKIIDDDYIENELYNESLIDICFIHQENLNFELKEFLLQFGFKPDKLEFIDLMNKVNTTDKKQNTLDYRELFIETRIQNKILERDKLLFKIFPEYIPTN